MRPRLLPLGRELHHAGPLEAVAGMLMLGVSTAVLFAVIDVPIRRDPAVAPDR